MAVSKNSPVLNRPSHEFDDVEFIRRALAQADANVLRIAMLQITQDPVLERMRVEKMPFRGGAVMVSVLGEEHHAEVREMALRWLQSRRKAPPPPPATEIRRLMELFIDGELSDPEFRFGLEELAFDEFPRNVEWTKQCSAEKIKDFRVVVIGAGIGGLAAAIQLERLGIPYDVIERQPEIGGVWQQNSYPGARVDVNSYLYQFKFEKKYPWPEYFAQRKDTKVYLKHIADKYGVSPRIVFDTELAEAVWDEASCKWRLRLRHKDGKEEVGFANVLISASGLFATPSLPDIAGIQDFKGPIFHTTAWDHGFDVSGKRIGVIGTGSTGTQLVAAIASKAESVAVYQRTANWIGPVDGFDRKVTREVHWLFDHVPYYWNWFCYQKFSATSPMQKLQSIDPEWQARGGLISEGNDKLRVALTEYIRNQLKETPELIPKCIPPYAPLGRRLVVDNGWYKALQRDNVDLVVDGIERITEKGILTKDGIEREFDLIVLGSGFQVSRYLWPVKYSGRNGITLEDAWEKDGARAYLGMTMPGFPNLFMFYGPNGQPRAGGYYSWAEVWARYAVSAIVALIETGHRALECRQEVFDDYNVRMDEATKPILWETEGKGGYFLNKAGRSAINMPWRVDEYHAWMIAPNLDDYHMS